MKEGKIFTMGKTWLQCIGCGHKTDLLLERKFRCPKCNNLYDVKHKEMAKQESNSFNDFRLKFDIRASSARVDDMHCPKKTSGVWRFKELIMPYLPDEYIVSLGEGNVPILSAGKNLLDWIGDIELYIIFEGAGPTGSFKDFGGTVMMSVAKAMGIKAIGCASTGDTSAMTAAYAAAAGIKSFVILPKGYVSHVQLSQPLAYGSKVINIPGSFDDCMKMMQDLVNNFGAFPANSLNPTRIEGHQATAFLLAQFFNWNLPDWIVAPVGNGSNCSSIGKGLRLLKKLEIPRTGNSRILGCQSEAANPLAESWKNAFQFGIPSSSEEAMYSWKDGYKDKLVGETTATAARIGAPVSRDKVIREIIFSNGAMETALEKDLNEAVKICGKDGYYVCPQTGMALAGLRNSVKNGRIKKGARVVVVSTATGLKFTELTAKSLAGDIVELKNCQAETAAKALGL
jgi:threonine synthase